MAKPGDEINNPRTGQRMIFIHTSQDTHGEMLQIDCYNRPGGVREPEHIHPFQENRFKLISGSLMFRIAGKLRRASAGEEVVIPPKVPHYFWNGAESEAHYIQEFVPALRSEVFFESLFDLARQGKLNDKGTANLLLMSVFVPRFWNEIRVTNPPEAVQKILFAILKPLGQALGYGGMLP